MIIELTVNGKLMYTDVHPLKKLVTILREDFELIGAKEGCGEGACGSCAVIIDGRLVNSCIVPAIQASGREILTVEGLGTHGRPDILQRAFIEEGAVQCGYCTPGMLMSSRALLEENHAPTRDEIKYALSGNICRCTGYEAMYRAVERAAKEGYCDTFEERKNLCSGELPIQTSEEDKKYIAVNTLKAALEILSQNEGAAILAGSTDTLPVYHIMHVPLPCAVDISRISELKNITEQGNEIHIGALVTNGDVIRSEMIKNDLPMLYEASRKSGSPAVQNAATVVGNIGTASGAGDMPTVFIALGARAVLQSTQGKREIPIEDYITGNRTTLRRPNELITEIIIPLPEEKTLQKYYKCGTRESMTISQLTLAALISVKDGRVTSIRAASGNMTAHAIRLHNVENALTNAPLDAEHISAASDAIYKEPLTPLKNADWALKVTSNLLVKFLKEAAEEN